MSARSSTQKTIAALAALWLLATPMFGLTLEELRRDPKLTPKRFARYFENFKFAYHAEVQAPETFLATETGDCDDYAILAAGILREKGYTTRLVAVILEGTTHVVCYVAETRCYLDYNNREFPIRTVASNGSLADIARKVARSLGETWTSVSEFTFAGGLERAQTTMTRDKTRQVMPIAQNKARDIPINF